MSKNIFIVFLERKSLSMVNPVGAYGLMVLAKKACKTLDKIHRLLKND